MTDYVSSFLDNIKQKTTNPFLGTIIFVTLVRYWDLVYAFFMFDDDCDMLYKQTYIHNYFAVKSFWKEISLIVFQSFLILIATYILLALSRLLLKFYEKHLISRADQLTDKNSVKTLIEYQALERRLAEIFEQLKKVNTENNELEIRVSTYKGEISERETKISELNIKIGEVGQEITGLTKNCDELKEENASLKSNLQSNQNIINDLQVELKAMTEAYEAELKQIKTLNEEINNYRPQQIDNDLINENFKSLSLNAAEIIVQLNKDNRKEQFIDVYESISKSSPADIKYLEYDLLAYFDEKKLISFTGNRIRMNGMTPANVLKITDLGREIYLFFTNKNEVKFTFNNSIDFEGIPFWLKDEESRRKILDRFEEFKNTQDYRTLTKKQKKGLNDLLIEGLFFEFLYYVDFILYSENEEVYLDLANIKVYETFDLMSYPDIDVIDDEIKVKDVIVEAETELVYNYLSKNLDK